MKERPILFKGPMVRAILDGRKTQTRRVIKKQPHGAGDWIMRGVNWLFPHACPYISIKCPYGQSGDRLWVRETWGYINGITVYRVDSEIIDGNEEPRPERWKSPYHMFRKLSRINLEVTAIRIERLQDISDEDARAEGVDWNLIENKIEGIGRCQQAFINLWDSINASRGYSWDSNPWVWVIEFKRIK